MSLPAPIASTRTGSGDPLLLLHPFAMSHHVWRAVAPALADTYDVFAPTLPAHWGGPPLRGRDVDVSHLADELERMLDEIGWDTCHIAGNSLGGWLALELAKRGRARSVTAIAPAGGWVNPSSAAYLLGARFLAAWPAIRLTGRFANRRPVLRNQFLRVLSGDRAAVSMADSARAIAAIRGCTGYLPLLWNMLRADGITGLDEIHCPVELVLCGDDRIVPERYYAKVFLDGLPKATVTRLPGRGHVPMLEAPAEIARAIRESAAAG